jgi:anaerobic magnesium-protoporphyrin IX monomethyl ester cyclase
VRLVDQTAERLETDALIERLERENIRPTLILFPSTTPTFDADVSEVAKIKAHFGAPMFCFGPHASTVPAEAMARAPELDGLLVGEPESGALALAALPSIDHLDDVANLSYRRAGGVVPHKTHGKFEGFGEMPYPAWDLLPLRAYSLPLVGKPYLIVETSRGCPYACDFCVAPIHQGHKFRERPARELVDEIERGYRDYGIEYFYLWGDTVTLNAKSFSAFCDELIDRRLPIHWFGNARADNLTDPAFVHRLKRAGCWMLALGIETESDDVRKDMMKRLERAKIEIAIGNMREAGIRSFAFFIFGYPGENPQALERTSQYARELDPDFANFYPAVPYPGTALYDKAKREGLLAADDWSRMEYSYYLLKGNGLDEPTLMRAIRRARRRFYLRPSYLRRHFGDGLRVVTTKQAIATRALRRMFPPTRKVSAGA